MASDANPADTLRNTIRADVRAASGIWWWFLILGILWTCLGMFILSYRAGSLAAVAALAGVTFLFGGVAHLVTATRAQGWRWLYIVAGIAGIIAGIMAFVWPDVTLYVVSVLVAWYLVVFGLVHLVSALAGPKLPWWWTGLLLGIFELVLGVWAVSSWQRSLLTLITLVGVSAICLGVNEIFAAFTVREVGRQTQRLIGDRTAP